MIWCRRMKPHPQTKETMNDERKEWLSRSPDEALSKKLGIVAWILTAVVLVLVGLMRRPELCTASFASAVCSALRRSLRW